MFVFVNGQAYLLYDDSRWFLYWEQRHSVGAKQVFRWMWRIIIWVCSMLAGEIRDG